MNLAMKLIKAAIQSITAIKFYESYTSKMWQAIVGHLHGTNG